MKTHYDILGVPQTATQEQIVTAYRLRSKVLHPDRFDRSKQLVEWDLANELLKELNGSYAILRDATSRAEYDRAIGVSQPSSTQQRSSASTSQSPPPWGDIRHPVNLVAVGSSRFHSAAFRN